MNGYEELLGAQPPDLTIPPGWDFWAGQSDSKQYDYLLNANGVLEAHDSAPEDYSPDVLMDYALEFLADVEEPFFLMLAVTVPHAPADSPPDSDCPGREGEIFERQDCSLEAADDAVAQVVAALGDSFDDTLVIYTSDNGFIRNEHGRTRGKNCPYDECLRVPLVIRYPPLVASPGSTNSAPVVNLDVTATILDAAGSSLPSMTGSSILPLLSGAATSLRPDFLFEMSISDPETPLQIVDGVRDRRWKLIVWPDGSEELYNIKRDPGELKNKASRPSKATLLQNLRERLAELRLE
jgi:arylsulfatase A-like enzyme